MSQNQMIPFYVGCGFFGALLLFLPCCVKKGPNQGVIRCSMIIAVISMWLFWATVFIAQLHPLIGPRHKNTTLIWYMVTDGLDVESIPAITYSETKEEDEGKEESVTADKNNNPAVVEPTPDKNEAVVQILRTRPSHCQHRPNNLFECCNIPWLPKRVKTNCIGDSTDILKLTCEEARCSFENASWSVRPGVVVLPVVAAFYDGLEKNDPEWAHAVHFIKEECLQMTPKHQGTYTDCPEYDIIYCVAMRMLKHAPLRSWSTAAACQSVQEFVSSCPLCPVNCNKRNLKGQPASVPRCQACLAF